MGSQGEVMAAEDRFFQALLKGDRVSLTGVLAPDFLLIDVVTGSEVPGPVLIDLVGSGQLRFDTVDRIDVGTVAVEDYAWFQELHTIHHLKQLV